MEEPLELVMQGTPNPHAMKFTLNRVVATEGRTFRDAHGTEIDWAKQLLGIPGVTQVFAMQNFISVNKRPEAEWHVIGPQAEQVLRRAFA